MQGRAAKKNMIRPVRVRSRKRARKALRVGDDGVELLCGPGGHSDSDRTGVTWLVGIDGDQPLLKSFNWFWRLFRGGLGRAWTRD
jgi:hypothetical protein